MATAEEISRSFAAAYAAHERGDLAKAESGYHRVLALQPRHFDALHMLGVVQLQAGRPDAAAQSIGQAVRLQPGVALAWLNLAAAHRAAGRPGDAADCLERKIALAGEDAGTLRALAALLQAAGRAVAASGVYRRLCAAAPGDVELLVAWAASLCDAGHPADALAPLEAALELAANHPDILTQLGIALHALGRNADALDRLDAALRLAPRNAAAHNARALTLWSLNRTGEAERAYTAAIEADPGHAEAWSNRAALRSTLGQDAQALADYRQALALAPSRPETLNGLGVWLAGHGQAEEAIAHYRQAITLRPDFPQAQNNMGLAWMQLGRVRDAMACYDSAIASPSADSRTAADSLANRSAAHAALQRAAEAAADARAALARDPHHPYTFGQALFLDRMRCRWQGHAADLGELNSRLAAGQAAATPFVAVALSDEPALHLDCAARYARIFPAGTPWPADTMPGHGDGRIRVAWVSADFHEHATAYLLAGVIEKMDRLRFEMVGVSYGPVTADRYQQRLRKAFDRYLEVGRQSDAEVVEQLRANGIDIAIDLKGYTRDARPGIFARRAAPVQVSYLGYPGTSGMPAIDYFIADETTVPMQEDRWYSEAVVRMPGCYQCNDDARPLPGPPPHRADVGLPEKSFVFCCFNNAYKITPEVLDAWARVLHRVAGSVLWLLHDNPEAEANLRREAGMRGIASDRLVFAPRLAVDAHIARHACADLFLDTWPVNAHTTASDALWAGLPIVTLPTRAFAGRVAASLLQAAGLSEGIAQNPAEYEELAVGLAQDPQKLAALRSRAQALRTKSPLFDTALVTRRLEQALQTMHARRLSGLEPASFAVER